MPKRYWLMKSEPGTYSIDDLARDGTTRWEGVRNYQARNFMRDQMQVGDGVLFYHSSCDVPGVAGLAEVARKAYPDPSQFDRASAYHDGDSKPDDPRWWLVDIKFAAKLPAVVPLDAIKANPKLKAMKLIQRGQRLSVQPVTAAEWAAVLAMAGVAR
jgi:predicted RNA-binding protein with PUA-like domain